VQSVIVTLAYNFGVTQIPSLFSMSKTPPSEPAQDEDEDLEGAAPIPAGAKNYVTPQGHARLKEEALHLLNRERPELVKVVAWAASNGDRSENADYIYGKRRLREIDRRIRFLTKRLDKAEVIDPAAREQTDQVFFGATVTVMDDQGSENTYSIVGIDEADVGRGRISWISPLARALLKRREGDEVAFKSPGGDQVLEIVRVEYKELA
jgi:transcription elongation factor GreB